MEEKNRALGIFRITLSEGYVINPDIFRGAEPVKTVRGEIMPCYDSENNTVTGECRMSYKDSGIDVHIRENVAVCIPKGIIRKSEVLE